MEPVSTGCSRNQRDLSGNALGILRIAGQKQNLILINISLPYGKSDARRANRQAR